MNTTIATRVVPAIEATYINATTPIDLTMLQADSATQQAEEAHPWVADVPSMLILQPSGRLDGTNSLDFQLELEQALERASDGVIVDLLWIHSADDHGIATLVAGIQQATERGKILSFQSMNHAIRAALDAELSRQHELHLGSWSTLFKPDLEKFLGMMQK